MRNVLFYPQPQASEICGGTLRIVHSDALLEEFSNVVIYGDEQVDNPKRSIEQIQTLRNEQLFGIVPEKIPTKAVIGIATVGKVITFTEGKNNTQGRGYVYDVVRAYLFDMPLSMSKEMALLFAKMGIFESVPYHYVLDSGIRDGMGFLSLNVNKKVFFSITDGSEITLELTPDVAEQVLDEEGNLKEFCSFYVHHGGLVKRFDWNDNCRIATENDEEGNLILFKSDVEPSGDAARMTLKLFCSYKQ